MSSSAGKSNLFTVAIVGAAALKGKEVRDALNERSFPAARIKLLDQEDALGQLDQVEDEPTFIQGVLPENLEGVDFAFLTADESYVAKTWAIVRDSGSEIVDLSYALENNIDVFSAPPGWKRNWAASRGCLAIGAGGGCTSGSRRVALLLARLQKAFPVRLATAVIGSQRLNTGGLAWTSSTIKP